MMSDSRVRSILGGCDGVSDRKLSTLYFNGSHNNESNNSGAGCIISKGEVMVVAAAFNITETFPDGCTVDVAEAVALMNGLKLAKDCNVDVKLIIGDSKEIIRRVQDFSRPSKPPLSDIFKQIFGMINRFSIKTVLISREANQAADKLAFWGSNSLLRGEQLFRTYADLPPQVAEFVKQEMSCSSIKREEEGEGSSMAKYIGMAGAAAVGVGMFAWGVVKLLSESSSDQQEHNKSKAKALPTSDFTTYISNNYASSYNKNKSSNNHQNYYVLHFNGSDINQYNRGGAGCIIRNQEGELVVASAYNLDYLNVYPKRFHVAIAGAVALQNGLKLAERNNVTLHVIEGKNEEVINRVLDQQKRSPKVPLLSGLIDEIKEAIKDSKTQVKSIGEGATNEVAHELANYGSNMLEVAKEKIYFWEDELPPKVRQLLEQDKRIWRAQKFLV